jgi:hypothetical protein
MLPLSNLALICMGSNLVIFLFSNLPISGEKY